jgi:RNA polymerase sigma-70 factor (ECF subfamily)
VSARGARENPGDGDGPLVQRVQKGDHEAFELLVVKYQERVFRLLRRLLGNQEQVEDLAQEVFIRAYRSLGSFKGESSFYTWLYKIALNTYRNYYRSLGRRPEGSVVSSAHVLEGMQSRGSSPEKEAFRSEFWDVVKSSLQDLPEEQREAIVLCDLEGLSYEEMATVIGIPVGTVRSRVFRGRRSLQKLLTPYLPVGTPAREEKKH